MKQEVIFRGLMALLGIWFLVRFVSPLLGHYFMEFFSGNKKRKNVDMDILIRRQESILRQGLSQKPVKSSSENSQSQSKSMQHYQDAFANGDTHAKLVLAIHDELQWGDGKQLIVLAKKIKKSIGIDWSTSALAKKLNFIFAKDIPLIPKKPMSFEQISSVVALVVFFETLKNQSELRRGQTLDFIANRSMLMPLDIALGFEAWQMDIMGKTRVQIVKALGSYEAINNPQSQFNGEKVLLKIIHLAIDSKVNYIDWAKNQTQLFSELIASIKPVKPIDNKSSVNEACEILGVSPKISTENLKKVYKKQAKLRHPDTLSAKKIPSEYEEKAQENFIRIKTAYDIIMKEKG